MEKEVTLKYLFFNFLKIGATSFGGFMAMVSVIQDQFVSKNKIIKNEIILDGVSLASVMPGPLAVNVVTFIGYKLKGVSGALVSMMAVILPSYFLVLGLSWSYLKYGTLPIVDKIFSGIIPAVIAIIITVAIRMSTKSISVFSQWIICVFSGMLLIFIGGFLTTLGLFFFGGISGYFLYNKNSYKNEISTFQNVRKKKKIPFWFFSIFGVAIICILILPLLGLGSFSILFIDLRKLLIVFGNMSITLFGGGYVFIPAIQETVVTNLHWLTNKEFSDSIAMGQITPGPILISATFIGFKVAGVWGSIVATTAIFIPSGILMIIGSHFLEKINNSNIVVSIFKGLRPTVIGMIFASSFTIAKSAELNWQFMLIFLVILFANIKLKINAAFLIPISGILGIALFNM